ncbi:DNA-directed DNA polymerase II small subunit [Methanobacterium petrolearium]|uniref:DNA-directed DNA polymerase II small subunit n=1 Tax=Methanobacterium petrolearium TaxID=710190 RepID=UPI001AE37769|nr:DNA-directed DNA polymerase II small subunit [Methanobacterium petrolearium]MBP1944821.1 DNA polymerase II small subunit [Methanobacterium petrolearium]BDZ70105.1 DNA polymerase II small subunit [Methanobacterium petrolearium]
MTNNIISKFADAEILLDETAYHKIKNYEDSSHLVDSLIDHLTISSQEMMILTGEVVDNYLGISNGHGKISELAQSKLLPQEFDFEIIKDASHKSYTNGEIKDLSSYFKNRYQKLREMLISKRELSDANSVKEATSLDDVVKIVGMINDIRNTKNNHKIIELEDETGSATVLIHNENHELFEQAERIVKDEVIGVVGSRKGSLIMASELINPGVPRVDEKKMDFGTVFLSDTHIGSSTFLEDAFNRFIRWINGDYGDEEQREIANNVKYIVVAGDIVDGIGVYPSQDKELTIKDIHQQYEEAARLFGDISNVKIIITPGNHDASRLAEPQPAIPEDYAKDLYDLKNAEFLSNPSMVSLDGLKVLIYHGRSFDDMAMTVKGMSHQQSDLIMKELLEKRHLAPIYGERTPLASEIEDHLVIDEIPDVFHTGHVHINSYKRYKGIHLINSGTFQSQTEFQKIYNIVPTCAQVPVLNNGSLKMLDFS